MCGVFHQINLKPDWLEVLMRYSAFDKHNIYLVALFLFIVICACNACVILHSQNFSFANHLINYKWMSNLKQIKPYTLVFKHTNFQILIWLILIACYVYLSVFKRPGLIL